MTSATASPSELPAVGRRERAAAQRVGPQWPQPQTCPLAARGHNRDGKKGKLQVNYGLLTNRKGIPVSVSVFEGNTGDPKTLLPQIEKIRGKFSIEQFVLVGDRGMLTQKQIDVPMSPNLLCISATLTGLTFTNMATL